MSTSTVMRPPRRLLFFLAGLGFALLLTAGLALIPSVQTRFVQRLLAAHPEWGATVDRVSVLPWRARIAGLRWSGNAAEVVAPEVSVEFDPGDLVFNKAVAIRAFHAKAWSVVLREDSPARNSSAVGSAKSPAGEGIAGFVSGLLRSVELPVNTELHGVDLEGSVMFPGRNSPAMVSVRGGGFAAGREGQLELAVRWESGDPKLGTFVTQGGLKARMEDPRRFSEVSARLESAVRSEAFPAGATLTTDVRLFREREAEGYRIVLATPRHAVLELAGELRPGADRLRGVWRLDLTSADLAPLALGLALPEFHARGDGTVDSDAAAKAPRAAGKISLDLSRLEVVRPELQAIGAVKLRMDFDAGWSAGVVSVARFAAQLEGKRPVLEVEVSQPFLVDPARHEWRASKAEADLARVRLVAVPTAWLVPWVSGLAIDGGDWNGEIAAVVADGALSLRTRAAIAAGGVSLEKSGEPWLHGVEVAFMGAATVQASGWQAHVERLVLRALGQDLARLEARLGRLSGTDQPVKAEGTLRLDLAQVVRQPAAEGRLALTSGEMTLKFGAKLGRVTEINADLRLEHLRGGAPAKDLPAVAVDLRAEVDAAGKIKFGAPLRMTAGERVSDVTLGGEFTPRGDGAGGRVEARLSGSVLHVVDGEALAAVLSAPSAVKGAAPKPAPGVQSSAPPWASWEGKLEIDLGEVVQGETVRMRDVKGKVELDAGKVRMEALRGSLGDRGRATISGALAFESGRPDPFAAEVQVEVREFDPGPWFRVASGGSPATLEGSFTLSSRLRGRAANLASLAANVAGEILVSSRGGIFRGLPVKVAAGANGAGRVAGMIAAAGSAIGSLTGRKEPPVIAGRAQAVAELAAGLGTIPFDQLSLVITRDAARNTTVREFTLIAPELRLTGAGTLLQRGDNGFLDDSLALEFSLRARGRQGDLLRHLGLLDPAVDDLGYASCRLPVRVAGTPARPDCAELAARLTAVASGKPGMADKAGELLQRIIGAPK